MKPLDIKRRLKIGKTCIGVDPATTSDDDSDDTGIVVVGKGPHRDETCSMPGCRAHGYVLQDATLDRRKIKPTPSAWGHAVVDAYTRWDADMVVIEKQPAGEMGRETIWTVKKVPVQFVNAKDNKKLRAEPIALLYEQGRIHHVGEGVEFLMLEEEMTSWVEGDRNSPDRLDALVYALTWLGIRKPLSGTSLGMTFPKTDSWGALADEG